MTEKLRGVKSYCNGPAKKCSWAESTGLYSAQKVAF